MRAYLMSASTGEGTTRALTENSGQHSTSSLSAPLKGALTVPLDALSSFQPEGGHAANIDTQAITLPDAVSPAAHTSGGRTTCTVNLCECRNVYCAW